VCPLRACEYELADTGLVLGRGSCQVWCWWRRVTPYVPDRLMACLRSDSSLALPAPAWPPAPASAADDHAAGEGPVAGRRTRSGASSPPTGSTAAGTAMAPRSSPARESCTSIRCWTWARDGSPGSRSGSITTRAWPTGPWPWRTRCAAGAARRGVPHRSGQRVHGACLPAGMRAAGRLAVDGPAGLGAGQRGDRVVALHPGVRVAVPAHVRDQGSSAHSGRGVDPGLQPRPEALRPRHGQPVDYERALAGKDAA